MNKDLPKVSDFGGQYYFYCPACNAGHSFNTDPKRPNVWQFNGDLVKPTFTPSLLIRFADDDGAGDAVRCHSFVTDGKIKYLNDCSHAMAGKTVEMEGVEV